MTDPYSTYCDIKKRIHSNGGDVRTVTRVERQLCCLYENTATCYNCSINTEIAHLNKCSVCYSYFCVLNKNCYHTIFGNDPDQCNVDKNGDILNCPNCTSPKYHSKKLSKKFGYKSIQEKKWLKQYLDGLN